MKIEQIESELNHTVCPKHNQKANVRIETLGGGQNIQIQNACCPEFEKMLSEKGVDLIVKGMDDDFMNNMKW